MVTTVDGMPGGKSGVIVGIGGNWGVVRRLESMGFRPGKVVTKLSSQFMAGPITVMLDGRHVAMGRGIASRVQVQVRP